MGVFFRNGFVIAALCLSAGVFITSSMCIYLLWEMIQIKHTLINKATHAWIIIERQLEAHVACTHFTAIFKRSFQDIAGIELSLVACISLEIVFTQPTLAY